MTDEQRKAKQREKSRRYYQRHKEKCKERSKQYYSEHKEEYHEKAKQFYKNNKQSEKERHKKYYLEHLDEIKEKNRIKNKIYYQKNKEKCLKQKREYYKNQVKPCVYCYIKKETSEIVYIGSTNNLTSRHKCHKIGSSHIPFDSILSENKDKFEIKILEECSDRETAYELEKELIFKYKPKYNVYNKG